jgi:hypothetical protein
LSKLELYAATINSETGGQIWRSSDGIEWTQVNEDGFGDANNTITEPGAVLDGYLYAVTANDVSGGSVWRSSDGVTWTRVSEYGFDNTPNVVKGHKPKVLQNCLYVGTDNEYTGGEIWRGVIVER